jgi:hypothetical protein
MSLDQKQQHEDRNIHIDYSTFNSQVVQTIVPINKHKSLAEGFDRREFSSSSNKLSPTIDHQITRVSSAPTISRLVGSNKYFFLFCFIHDVLFIFV